jgi:hypothetical protein
MTPMPFFSFNSFREQPDNRLCWFILADNVKVHEIKDLDAFYAAFGYTLATAREGELPEEFIWDEYIKCDPHDRGTCLQMHIVEYLAAHSDWFVNKYGNDCREWFAEHGRSAAANSAACATCRARPVCKLLSFSPLPPIQSQSDVSLAAKMQERRASREHVPGKAGSRTDRNSPSHRF